MKFSFATEHPYLTTLFLTLIMSFFALPLMYFEAGHIFYTDTDSYTRALRVVDWLQNFSWNEKLFPYSNPPDGFELHFTRALDWFWLIFSLPFLPLLSLKSAVFYAGFYVSKIPVSAE